MMNKFIGIITFSLFVICSTTGAIAQSAPPAAGGAPQGGAQGVSSSKTDKITSIKFTGNKKFTEKQLLEAIKVKVGDDLSSEIMDTLLTRVVDFYHKNGANLTVQPNLKPDQTKGTVDIEFIIDESGTKGNGGQYQPNQGSGGGQGGQPGGAASAGGTPPAAGGQPSGSGK
jgi:outer membrane protein assembly factor BamA